MEVDFMGVSDKFLDITQDTGRASRAFTGGKSIDVGRIDKRQIANAYGQEVLPRAVWRAAPGLAEGRATPFDSSINILDTDYNTWLASLKSNVSDADISVVDKELQDLELKHTGFKGDEINSSFMSIGVPDPRYWTWAYFYGASGAPFITGGIVKLFMASKKEQEKLKVSGLQGPSGGYVRAEGIKAALDANPGISGLTYEQALGFQAGTWVPEGKKLSIAPVAEFGDTLKYSSIKESLQTRKKGLEESKVSGLSNPYTSKVSELLVNRGAFTPLPNSKSVASAVSEALSRVEGFKALKVNPYGTTSPKVLTLSPEPSFESTYIEGSLPFNVWGDTDGGNYYYYVSNYTLTEISPAQVKTMQDAERAAAKAAVEAKAAWVISRPEEIRRVEASVEAKRIWDQTGAKWVPDQSKLDSYLKENPDVNLLSRWDSSRFYSELTNPSLDPELVSAYSNTEFGGSLGSLVRSRISSVTSFNERLKSFQDLQSSYTSDIEKEKASK